MTMQAMTMVTTPVSSPPMSPFTSPPTSPPPTPYSTLPPSPYPAIPPSPYANFPPSPYAALPLSAYTSPPMSPYPVVASTTVNTNPGVSQGQRDAPKKSSAQTAQPQKNTATSSNGSLGKKQAPAAPIKLDNRPAKKHGMVTYLYNWIYIASQQYAILHLPIYFKPFPLFPFTQLLLRSQGPCVLPLLLPQRWSNTQSQTLSTSFPATTSKTSSSNIKHHSQNPCQRNPGVCECVCAFMDKMVRSDSVNSIYDVHLFTGEMVKHLRRSWTRMMKPSTSWKHRSTIQPLHRWALFTCLPVSLFCV